MEVGHFGVFELVKNKNHQSPITPVLFICTEEVGRGKISVEKGPDLARSGGRNPENNRGVQLTTYVAANSDVEVSSNIVLCQFLPNRHGSRYNEHNGYKRVKSSGQSKVCNFS